MIPILGAVMPVVSQVLDRVLPDEGAREAAKLELMKAEQAGDLKAVEAQLSAILAEANSSDPWTSRARPSFLYVIYTLLLAAIPMGVIHAVSPETATNIAAGFGAWLRAIPDELYTLFGIGYLGYTGARTWDKRRK